MKHQLLSYKDALEIIHNNEEYSRLFNILILIINNITDEQILKYYDKYSPGAKSISKALNRLIKDELIKHGYRKEVRIYDTNAKKHKGTGGKVDFVNESGEYAIEVAFNNVGSLPGTFQKLRQSTHIHKKHKKNINTKVGIIICASLDLRKYGGFDEAILTYCDSEAFLDVNEHENPYPVVIIGLDRPETFNIEQYPKKKKGKKTGKPIPRID